jgi:hypothetical protein
MKTTQYPEWDGRRGRQRESRAQPEHAVLDSYPRCGNLGFGESVDILFWGVVFSS